MSTPANVPPQHSPAVAENESAESTGGLTLKAPAFQLMASGDTPIQRQQAPGHQSPSGAVVQRLTREEELTGQFDPRHHPDFVKVEMQGTREHYLRREVAVSLNLMQAAASAAGFTLTLVSSTRNFADQRTIWNNKWNQAPWNQIADPAARSRSIMEYSSMPGTSRHHWGTDMDFNSVRPSDWVDAAGRAPAGRYNRLYNWMQANAANFGFAQTYSPRGSGPGQRPTGYNEERWHWSYVPIASGMQTEFTAGITDQTIAGLGFDGASSAPAVHAVTDYVDSVAPGARTTSASMHRPTVQGTVTVTNFPLRIRQEPNATAPVLMQVTASRTFNYYQEQTDAQGNIWVLVEEGWFARRYNGTDNATVTPTPAAPQQGGGEQGGGGQ